MARDFRNPSVIGGIGRCHSRCVPNLSAVDTFGLRREWRHGRTDASERRRIAGDRRGMILLKPNAQKRTPKPLKRTPLKRGTSRIRGRVEVVHVVTDELGVVEILGSCHKGIASCVSSGLEHMRRVKAVGSVRRWCFVRSEGVCEKEWIGVRCTRRIKERSMHMHEPIHRSKGKEGHISRNGSIATCGDCHERDHPEKNKLHWSGKVK